jgi:hypothetical protein
MSEPIGSALLALKSVREITRGLAAADAAFTEAELKLKFRAVVDQLSDAQDAMLDVKEEIISLKQENAGLKATLQMVGEFSFRNGLCWKSGDPDPYCPRCWEADRKAIHVHRKNDVYVACQHCGKAFSRPS